MMSSFLFLSPPALSKLTPKKTLSDHSGATTISHSFLKNVNRSRITCTRNKNCSKIGRNFGERYQVHKSPSAAAGSFSSGSSAGSFAKATFTDATTSTVAVPPEFQKTTENNKGIGISQYLTGKNIFITGATGFIGKALVEKLLRCAPDVGKLFLMMKTENKEAAIHRLRNEIIDSDLFKLIKGMHGEESYVKFMESKLVPVIGDISKHNMGMDEDYAKELAKKIDVIVSCGASTTFDERYDTALDTNTRGPSRLLSFAKKCNKLGTFLHVSTAYVNHGGSDFVSEKPFVMGKSLAAERAAISNLKQESIPELVLDAEMKIASNLAATLGTDLAASQIMKELGFERAKLHGWPNTYSFTKAMGEMLIDSTRGDVPVAVVRPTIVESTFREPFSGWIQGNRMLDPLISSYGKGLLPGFLADPEVILDVVPGDIVVNAVITALAKHGQSAQPGLTVYHVGSSAVKPLSYGDVFKFSRNHFNKHPLMDSRQSTALDEIISFSSEEKFVSYITSEVKRDILKSEKTTDLKGERIQTKCKIRVDYLLRLARIYKPYMFLRSRFDNSNTQKLIGDMSSDERKNFGFDVRDVDWEEYITNIHIPGLRRHVLKK